MIVRQLTEADGPALLKIAEENGFPYVDPFGPNIEASAAVACEDGTLVMAVAAARSVELYLWATKISPAAKIYALRLMHQSIAAQLAEKGYKEANAYLPPSVARSFGKRLERTFGWVKNWASWCVSLSKHIVE